MSLVIRLTKTGKKRESKFRVIVKEKRDRRDGKYLENLGWYEKRVDGIKKHIHAERVAYWMSVGAIPSATVRTLLEK